MATYYLPDEPDVDTVWSLPRYAPRCATSPGPLSAQRWDRTIAGWTDAAGTTLTWVGMLALGAVSDSHPALPPDAATPWAWDDKDGILDAHGSRVDLSLDDVSIAVVRAINTYAAELTGSIITEEDQ